MLAIADSSIIGKTYEDGDVQIEVKKDFYAEKTCDEKEALKFIHGATIVNAVGKDIIDLMVNNKIIGKSDVLYIGGVPHVQIVTMK